jgi:hypothetical protein
VLLGITQETDAGRQGGFSRCSAGSPWRVGYDCVECPYGILRDAKMEYILARFSC